MNKYGIENIGITSPTNVYRNLSAVLLVEAALKRNEGKLSETGALVIETGKYTGRSPDDKFIVDTKAIHDDINWGKVNKPIDEDKYFKLKEKMTKYLNHKDIYIFDGFAGADVHYTKKFRVINELASQNLFIHQLLIRPSKEELEIYGEPDFNIIVAPGFKCVPEIDGTHSEAAIIVNFEDRTVLIAGTKYSGEIKKSIFSVMNYLMTKEDVLPMHCSSNLNPRTGNTAIFFGLSGTGKTTISADPTRKLIGDDEHGWSDYGIFNFEGGCYAKCINLDPYKEADIYNAIKFGSVLENVVVNKYNRAPDYFDDSLTSNTRVAYPTYFINNSQIPGIGRNPNNIIFLTADAFGVLPPISRLSKEAAMYHYITGFTSKIPGTERGITKPQPTFSACFGEPFLPMNPLIYAKMLGEKIDKHHSNVFLVNTGWQGGQFGVGKRIALEYTRAMVSAALSGFLDEVKYVHDDVLNLDIPTECRGIPSEILNPQNSWQDKDAYKFQRNELAILFEHNFDSKYSKMKDANIIKKAGPKSKKDS
ncbi:MAG: phosphoenolpyruvate carboxykinase (ATP) [Thomasclavelia sp.]|nr:phosphoenolpyruvate carboxykinase (ATP) [Thomasclavelia sp.]